MTKTLPIILLFFFTASNVLAASYYERPVEFESNGKTLTGALVLPKTESGPFAVAVFIHGDGALPYDAHGYYRFLWEELAKKGVASFSWNKPGVNGSSGDWESQSMHERAADVNQALLFLHGVDEIDSDRIGLIGFSQAGWVIPLTNQAKVAFNVIVSGAINWLQQGSYLTRKRMLLSGYSEKETEDAIAASISFSKKQLPYITYTEYKKIVDREHSNKKNNHMLLMSESRFRFAKKNWHYDSTKYLNNLKSPTLFVFGKNDEYVDIENSINIYNKELVSPSNGRHRISVYPSAQHGLLKSKYFEGLKPGAWFVIKLELLGKKSFANKFLFEIADWAYQNTN